MSRLFNLVCNIFNWLPILHVSCDSDFGSYNQKSTDLRLSLFSLSLGQHKYYLLSLFKANDKWAFQLYKDLNFYDVCSIDSEKLITDKVDKFDSQIKSKGDESISILIELLKEKISQNQNRITSSFSKLNSYRAIILAFSGVGAYLLTKLIRITEFSYLPVLSSVLLLLFAIYAFNAFKYVTLALTIKSFVRSSFKDLKIETSKLQLAKCFYTDLVSKNNESHVIVSITKNAEKYFSRCSLMLFLAWISVTVSSYDINLIQQLASKSNNFEYLIINEKKELQTKQLALFFDNLDDVSGTIYAISNDKTAQHDELIHFLNRHLSKNQQLENLTVSTEILKDNVMLLKYKGKK